MALSAILPGAAPAVAETLTVQLRNVRSNAGEVQLDLYTVARKRVAKKRVPARTGAMRVDFAGLPAGAYGVYVYHDENGNGKLDTGGLLGLPVEGYAFSNDAKASFGPPSIEDLKVTLSGGGAVTAATMRYRLRR
ncbi:DUF2141 domain-containing protein [uncultured Sphingomonas sp.]|uniref:DUF2141 domain-containing protein n=1 Tax=uncultured Sphingomonas sp. TaxID=158754 RepID=UPI0025DCB5A9|nr:DUF2141 domain-containing protein [uncultured Sphingomonas sp.]